MTRTLKKKKKGSSQESLKWLNGLVSLLVVLLNVVLERHLFTISKACRVATSFAKSKGKVLLN